MNKFKYFIVCLMAGSSLICHGQQKNYLWPGGAKAAVCLTYDDGIDSHLDIAIPDLEKENLRGTFYIEGMNLIPDRVGRWKKAAGNGHELGNHTIFHPCSEELDFIRKEFSSENYTINRFLKELEAMNNFLYAVDGKKSRSFAYTCGETMYGGISVIDTLRVSGLFPGARGGSPEVVRDMKKLDLFNIPSFVALDETAGEMIPYVEEAKKAGSLAVFMFHGVGGDYLTVSREDHYRLLRYLSENRDDYWTAPFNEVVEYIIKEKKRHASLLQQEQED